MAELVHVSKGIDPTYDAHSRVLVLGSMASPKSRETGYNYGHPQNRFWRVLATLADVPVPQGNDDKRAFVLRHHIALWDVVASCDIAGASDTSIRNVVPNDLTLVTRAAPIQGIFCTGAKAHELYRRHCEAAVGLPATRLPSTSPANAACTFERLLEAYRPVLEVARLPER